MKLRFQPWSLTRVTSYPEPCLGSKLFNCFRSGFGRVAATCWTRYWSASAFWLRSFSSLQWVDSFTCLCIIMHACVLWAFIACLFECLCTCLWAFLRMLIIRRSITRTNGRLKVGKMSLFDEISEIVDSVLLVVRYLFMVTQYNPHTSSCPNHWPERNQMHKYSRPILDYGIV